MLVPVIITFIHKKVSLKCEVPILNISLKYFSLMEDNFLVILVHNEFNVSVLCVSTIYIYDAKMYTCAIYGYIKLVGVKFIGFPN